MTLREYVLTRRSSQRTRHVLLGQLLEAIVCVSDAQFAHRDLKSDNVLLSFDDEGEWQLSLSSIKCRVDATNVA